MARAWLSRYPLTIPAVAPWLLNRWMDGRPKNKASCLAWPDFVPGAELVTHTSSLDSLLGLGLRFLDLEGPQFFGWFVNVSSLDFWTRAVLPLRHGDRWIDEALPEAWEADERAVMIIVSDPKRDCARHCAKTSKDPQESRRNFLVCPKCPNVRNHLNIPRWWKWMKMVSIWMFLVWFLFLMIFRRRIMTIS